MIYTCKLYTILSHARSQFGTIINIVELIFR